MTPNEGTAVDEYIARHPDRVRAILRRVRSTIRKAVPGAEEVINYQIPTYRLHGGYVVYFAGWKEHYSLYPATGHLVAAFKEDLAPYEVSKGTIRFPLSQPVPVKLIERIARFLAKKAAERARARLAAPRKRRSAKPRTIDDYLAGLSAEQGKGMNPTKARLLPADAAQSGSGGSGMRSGPSSVSSSTSVDSTARTTPSARRSPGRYA